jgi:hypothetical protein
MPVKHAAGDGDLPLTPAMTFCLMTGQAPDVRIRGWVALAQEGQCGEPTLDQVWAAHHETLIAQAKAAGFEPYWLRSREPAGRAFRSWRDAFLREHSY